MIILGIDPGNVILGYGVVKKEKGELKATDFGCVFADQRAKEHQKLFYIQKEFKKMVQKYNPDIVSIEKLFFFKNQKTIIKVSQSRGVILAACGELGIKIKEYTPLEVKQAVCGYGRADKKQVQNMVKIILKLKETPKPDDAADALAVAICATNCLI